MARTDKDAAPRRRYLIPAVAVGTATAVVAGAIIVNGYDAQDVPPVSTAVWVTRGDNQYARVNTELGQIDTVKSVENPVGMVQSGAQSVVFSQGYSQAWPIDASYPVNFESQGATGAASPVSTPAGTSYVATAGAYIVYLTELGDVYLGTYPEPGTAQSGAWQLDPFADADLAESDSEEAPHFTAAAVSVNEHGTVVMYSAAEKSVRTYDADSAEFIGEPVAVASAPDANELSMTLAGDSWVLFSAADGRAWAEGLAGPTETGLGDDAVLQATPSPGEVAYIADASGLTAFSVADGATTQAAAASGTPAAPVTVGGTTYAAWISPSGAALWTGDGQPMPVQMPAGALDDVQSVDPVFRTNGDRAVLTEFNEGLIWTVPDGALVPTEDWDPLEEPDLDEGESVVEDVVEQEPPVAIADTFGVRRGEAARLPLLYNDSDPNKGDGLSISPESLGELGDESFGRVSLIDNNQTALVQVAADSGSTSFSYAATDGADLSEPVTVTLNVVPETQQTAPVWCGVESCKQEWPTPQIVPGGFVEVPVLEGWVDPEGDPIALVDAVAQDAKAPVTVVPTADGTVAIRHVDPNAADTSVPIEVTVSDSYGLTATKVFEIKVTSAPPLEASPIVVAAGVDDPRQIAIADFVTGGSGSYQLVDAVAGQKSENFSVSPVVASGEVQLSAAAPGDYVATYTVEDTQTRAQQTAVLRLTVSSDATTLSLPPLTAFVRPQEDSTLDVLAAAQNTTGRVLLLSSATTTEPNLAVSIVDNTFLRISGQTSDGMPGLVGTADIVVSDGAGTSATARVTVFMLAPSESSYPIAVPDAVTVRAGTQVDIPVLGNDISPRGESLLLHPTVEGSGTDGELAFASGASLRYLAPRTPGMYTIQYTSYLENNPGRHDSAAVTISVLPSGSNRAPEPPTLIGRVLAGQAVTIPFDPVGVDPDGDATVLVDVAQPDAGSGVASVASSGSAVVYRAPEGGVPGGQVAFTYTVRDASGEEGQGKVTVGVLGSDASDVAPVTYSDRVTAQLGSAAPLTITPLANDHDPLNGTLRLISVVPNAKKGTDEYTRLERLLDASELPDGKVTARAGDIEGSHSYVYTVESSATLSTAQGLIVVAATPKTAPSQLVVTDTTLTATTRHELAAGVDVVSGKVAWQTGDPSNLVLSLWGPDSQDYTVSGWKIAGPLPSKSAVIPFSLAGPDFSGNEVVTYGFLRIPAFDDLRLQVRPGASPSEVEEDASVTIRVREALDVPADEVVELRSNTTLAVQRANASCKTTGDDEVTYSAGREAPWSDTCSVQVRLEGQNTWSVVALPVTIVPREPQPILSPASRTVSPGASAAVSLVDDMVTWEGGRVGDESSLALAAGGNTPSFDVSLAGGVLTAIAHSDAVPGKRERVDITSSAYGGLSSSITLVVGAAVPDTPRGATFTTQCDVSNGSSCSITAVGLPGEYDPFKGKPKAGLALQRVGSGSVSCPVATVTKQSETSMVASWPAGAKPLGGECTVPFSVVDAQGRPGQGRLNLDVLGYPQAPATVTTVDYSGPSVTLQVTLGQAANSHPSVSGVAIYRGGKNANAACSPSGPGSFRCIVSGLVNGEKAQYTARAVNSVGESADTSAVESWAYQAPEITNLTAKPIYEAGATDLGKGVVTISVSSSDDTKSFTVAGTGETVARTGSVTTFTTSMSVGPQQVELVPISKFEPPVSGANTGTSSSTSVTVAGSPFFEGHINAKANGATITVSGTTLNANYSAERMSQVWVAWQEGGSSPSCTMQGGSAFVSGSGVITSTSNIISGLADNTAYAVAVCGSNGFGAVLSGTATTFTFVAPPLPSGGTTYSIKTAWSGGNPYVYELDTVPSLNPPHGFTVAYFYNGGTASPTFDPGFNAGVDITAKYCIWRSTSRPPTYCGDAVNIEPASGSPSSKVRVSFPTGCATEPEASDVVFDGAQSSDATVTIKTETVTEPNPDETSPDPGSTFERPVSYEVTWNSPPYSNLAPISHAIEMCAATD